MNGGTPGGWSTRGPAVRWRGSAPGRWSEGGTLDGAAAPALRSRSMLLLSAAALAAFPEEVSILAMEDYGGSSTLPIAEDYVAEGYHTLVQELAVVVANPGLAPAETLGINGFAFGVGSGLAFIRTGSLDTVNPSGWDLADPDEDPPLLLYVPTLHVRKGLPLSLEVGANAGWIAPSEDGLFGGFVRWSPIEGWRRAPDLSFQMGYSGYVGNDELELGVLDASATIGYTAPFGVTQGIHQASFRPFAGVGQLRIHAAPRVDLSESTLEGRITEVSGFKKSELFDRQYAPLRVHGGFQVVNGDYATTLSATWVPASIARIDLSIGASF